MLVGAFVVTVAGAFADALVAGLVSAPVAAKLVRPIFVDDKKRPANRVWYLTALSRCRR